MHLARLVAIIELANVPPDIRPFVDFKAAVEERKLDDKERVAILNVDTTTCYIPVFLKDPPTLEQLEEDLRKQDTQLAADSREALAIHLRR